MPGLPLLSIKLNRPPVTGDRIDRPRLFAILNRGLAGSLSVVSAAAGFGKTTLVSSWIKSLVAPGRQPMPAAWLSLDRADSELEVFLRYFVAAIRTLYPEPRSPTTVPTMDEAVELFERLTGAQREVILDRMIERLMTRATAALEPVTEETERWTI